MQKNLKNSHYVRHFNNYSTTLLNIKYILTICICSIKKQAEIYCYYEISL
jgi:hypothetical protein